MSRFYPNEDGDALSQGRWEHNLSRSIAGKKGQAALRELRQALLALPEPKLVTGLFTTAEGLCCTLGALAAYRKGREEGISITEAARALHDAVDPEDSDLHVEEGKKAGLSETLAWHLGYQNDDSYEFGRASPEERFAGVLCWVNENITGKRDWTEEERGVFQRRHRYMTSAVAPIPSSKAFVVRIGPSWVHYPQFYCAREIWEGSVAAQLGCYLDDSGDGLVELRVLTPFVQGHRLRPQTAYAAGEVIRLSCLGSEYMDLMNYARGHVRLVL